MFYRGELIDFSWERVVIIFGNPDLPLKKSTKDLSNISVMVGSKRHTNVEFIVNDNCAPEDKRYSIAVTAYCIGRKQLKGLTLLDLAVAPFIFKLEEEQYINSKT